MRLFLGCGAVRAAKAPEWVETTEVTWPFETLEAR